MSSVVPLQLETARAKHVVMRGIRTRMHEARSGPELPGWTHARSYAGLSPANFVHRARLARLRELLRRLNLPQRGLLVDLGCSDGFVIGQLQRDGDLPRSWSAAGYEVDRRLLRAARRRHLANVSFRRIDLNDTAAQVVQPGDLVICLETLEHVGNYRHALRVLHNSAKPGGWIVLSMPNEVGLVGLIKFLVRPLLRRHAYGDFFTGAKEVVRYTVTLATRGDLERFRTPPRTGWGPHLGFDHRQVVHHIRRTFVDTGLWQVEGQQRSAFGANLFLVVRRVDAGSPASRHSR
jgi:2-polyprenyl-3-methyl-5-hydroxy-6-metoxy-1,4-benzoquinol methylase